MTREEAANILSNDIIDGHVEGNAKFMDAFWFAVDNLKAEPCEAVSRADTLQSFESYCENNCQYSKKQRDVMCGACMMGDAIEIVENLPPVTPKPTECEDAVSREAVLDVVNNPLNIKLDKIIEKLPSVTPKQRTGKIIMGGYDCDHYVCSECGHDFGWYSKPNHKYCPNCGAKMEGESE